MSTDATPTRNRGGRPRGPASKDKKAVAALLERCCRMLREGVPAISPKTGEPIVGEDGKVVMRPLSAADLQAVRSVLKDLGAFERAKHDPRIVPRERGPMSIAERAAQRREQGRMQAPKPKGHIVNRISEAPKPPVAAEDAEHLAALEAALETTRRRQRELEAAEHAADQTRQREEDFSSLARADNIRRYGHGHPRID